MHNSCVSKWSHEVIDICNLCGCFHWIYWTCRCKQYFQVMTVTSSHFWMKTLYKNLWCLGLDFVMTQIFETFKVSHFLFSLRYTKELELLAHLVLGPESLWNLLHFGCTWTLFYRCLHCLLHHYKTLFVLPYVG